MPRLAPARRAVASRICADFLRKAIAGIGEERFKAPFAFDDASWVSFRLAEILPLRIDVKQKMRLLELTDAAMRLAILQCSCSSRSSSSCGVRWRPDRVG